MSEAIKRDYTVSRTHRRHISRLIDTIVVRPKSSEKTDWEAVVYLTVNASSRNNWFSFPFSWESWTTLSVETSFSQSRAKEREFEKYRKRNRLAGKITSGRVFLKVERGMEDVDGLPTMNCTEVGVVSANLPFSILNLKATQPVVKIEHVKA